jgi:hypothetical protein
MNIDLGPLLRPPAGDLSVTFERRGGTVILSAAGTYRPGSAGSPDADALRGAVAAAIAAVDPSAVVLDLRALTYTWGDGMLRVLEAVDHPGDTPIALRLVVSDRCRDALASLLQSDRLLCDDPDQAVDDAAAEAGERAAWEEAHEDQLKMYLVVRDDLPASFKALGAAHAAVATYLHFSHTIATRLWACSVFRKVICEATAAEFEALKAIPDHVVLTESALAGRETALGFAPRAIWPGPLRHLKLYREPRTP